ncbi:F0F1 ATP synthase subunit delta [Tropicimonas isoalkanivorans]|uniref:ATP synthase subunit b n=1 Tax=Tropicimonas isoalkanivorans TaxID=441112 RepID=A0A1I1L208_9RHOB|nr:F0F1 ATP synthase subunit delta [Tropicimonas isoalkanivorans]SFC67097.1 ATP synthase F0 subcomplex B subunit [Tropicimonas isoalkanivorans]
MTIDWWTLGLQTLNFLVLLWILKRFLFRPVSRIIEERQAAAHAALDEAEAARREAREVRDAAQVEAERVAAARSDVLAAAQQEAEREKSRLLKEARAAADTALAEGAAELERVREAQARALAEDAAQLATDIAGRLLARLPEVARPTAFIDGLAEAVADLPDATRAGMGADTPLRVRAAQDMAEEERNMLRRRLGEVLGHSPKLTFEVDPGLVAGLELVGPHAVVRDHFRADLERIREELSRHD